MATWTINDHDLDTQTQVSKSAGLAALKNEPRASAARS
jgi:hypothetical protein